MTRIDSYKRKTSCEILWCEIRKKSEDKPSIAMTAVDGSQDVCRLDQVPGRVAVEMTALN
jgi:hypothetical protein